jgi:circadian clock protein KaiB
VDVTREPERALEDKVLLTPTLIKVAPAPARKIIGNLSDTPTVLLSLGLQRSA